MRDTAPGPLTGRTLEGRYQVGELIARGGMGAVYRGRDLRLQRPVAVKILKDTLAADPARRARFAEEARAAAGLSDPRVVGVWDQGTDAQDGHPVAFLVMELVDGATLRDLIRRRAPMTVREMLRVAVPVARGLAAAHAAGLVHRDVKPENVLTSPLGSVKVTDFGLTRQVQAESSTLTLVGSAHYIAPELVRREPAGTAADTYAVGIMVYEMLTGVPPFRGTSAYEISMAHVDRPLPDVTERFPGLDPEVAEIIAWCCDKRPDHRPQDAGTLAEELEHLGATLPAAALDARPPGYRPHRQDLFAALREDSHTDPVALVEAAETGRAPEQPAVVLLGPTTGHQAAVSAAETASVPAPVRAERPVRPEVPAAAGRDAPRPAAAASGHGSQSPSQGRGRPAPQGSRASAPHVPVQSLGTVSARRGWTAAAVVLVLLCVAAYLGWILGLDLLQQLRSSAAAARQGLEGTAGQAAGLVHRLGQALHGVLGGISGG